MGGDYCDVLLILRTVTGLSSSIPPEAMTPPTSVSGPVLVRFTQVLVGGPWSAGVCPNPSPQNGRPYFIGG